MTHKKKILHLITGLEVGGAETMLLKILPPTKDVVDHHVCSITGIGPIGDKLTAAGIPVYHLDLNHSLDLTIVPKLRQLIKELKPDVLITYLPHADLLGRIIGKTSGIPTIIGSVRVRLTKSKYLPFFILDGLTSPLVSHYHFNSQTIANVHQSLLNIKSKKITVIPNAININKYSVNVDITKKKSKLGISQNKTVIGCVARLRKQKGHPDLIAAFDRVQSKRPNTVLILVGDGEEKKNIVQEINSRNLQDKVIMLGNRHDVAEILQVIDIFALTTRYEGMSNSIMEAMAAKRPIVTTDIPENKELITHDQTGMLIPIGNNQATAQVLIELIDNPDKRDKLGQAAFQEVAQKLSMEAIIPRYKAFYESI